MKFFYNLLDGFEEPNRFYDEQTIRRFRVYQATPEIEKEAYENPHSCLWPVHDIRDGSFKEFTPDVVITNKIPWPYNPAAHDDLLDHTLNRLACDDPEVRALLEEMVGYCIKQPITS